MPTGIYNHAHRKNGKFKKCIVCKKSFYVPKCRIKKAKFCSHKCYHIHYRGKRVSINSEFKKGQVAPNKGKTFPQYHGKNHPRWKGGRNKNIDGYILIYCPDHPFQYTKYILEHRFVMEKHLGRYLTSKETVHHKGIKYPIGSIENKQDNRIENLQLFINFVEHFKFHKKIKSKPNPVQ